MWVIEYKDKDTAQWDVCVLDGKVEVFACKQLATTALTEWKDCGDDLEYRISEAYVLVSDETKGVK